MEKFVILILLCTIYTSCGDGGNKGGSDDYTPSLVEYKVRCSVCNGYGNIATMNGPTYCQFCQGSGEVSNWTYDKSSGGSLSFKGGNKSCNIPSHSCSTFVPMENDANVCANCYNNAQGTKCHKVKH